MPLPRGLPVVDHHCHLSPAGEGLTAARRFAKAGGTHLFLATQNYGPQVPRSLEEYRTQFETTEALAQLIRSETPVEVHPVVAPYPIDLVGQAAALGVEAGLALQRSALDLAGAWVRERRAVALGEVGRAHFPVEPPIRAAIDEAFFHALEVARDADCPAVVHSEDLDAAGFGSLAELAGRAGLRAERVVKHYARSHVRPDERRGVAASYLARRDLVRATLGDGPSWFLETDFLDDPHRPGAVLDLATVPRRAAAIAEHEPDQAERLWVPFSESIERVYGFRPEVREGPR
ncbi:MAG TPA: TatD family hydrolase [Thermoplasmata archaeon]|nr:TatD family hydrolase [Thermoplasmata archaeon]